MSRSESRPAPPAGSAGADLYVVNFGVTTAYVRAYGPPPDAALCPPPKVPPSITAQYATSVDSKGATLKAQINPNFWPDTRYYVEYGTGKCSEGGCDKEQPLAPGAKLTTETIGRTSPPRASSSAAWSPTPPTTTASSPRARAAARCEGSGGEVGSDGAEGTFTTFPLSPAPRTDCPNQAFRTAASAPLPDCRAYEMVSPVDKNGGDVSIGEHRQGLRRPAQVLARRGALHLPLAHLLRRSRASAPLVNQYLSIRGAEGWSTQSISPPRGQLPLWPFGFTGQFKAFSEDLCSAWLVQDSDSASSPELRRGVLEPLPAQQLRRRAEL